jgi:hypothetical protein
MAFTAEARAKAALARRSRSLSNTRRCVNTEDQQERVDGLVRAKSKYAPIFARVYAKKASLRQCIKAKCLDCSCWQRKEIEECPVTVCPLWRERPYQKKKETKE